MPVPVPPATFIISMAKRKRSFKRSYRRRTRKVPKTSKNASKSNLVRLIKTVVNRQIESKERQITIGPITVRQLISDLNVVTLMPGIAQGTGETNRIGNSVKPVSCRLKMSLYCFNQGVTTPPTYFDIFIFKTKFINENAGSPSALDMQLFLDNNNGATSYDGDTFDGIRPLNDELFKLCVRKRIMLFNPFNATNQLSSTASVNPSRTVTFDLTKYVKSVLQFDDNTILATNDNLYLAVGTTQTDGVKNSIDYGSYSALVDWKFKDA